MIIEVQDATGHTGTAYEDITCIDGDLDVSNDNLNGHGEGAGVARFNTASIPNDAVITNIELNFYVSAVSNGGVFFDFNEVENDPAVSTSCAQIWDDVTDGTRYGNGFVDDTGWWQADLGSSAENDMENLLLSNWFAVGFEHDDGTAYWMEVAGHDSSNRPYIAVTYGIPPEPDLKSVSGIPGSVLAEQSFTVDIIAENDGGSSSEGYITASVLYSDHTHDLTIANESSSEGTPTSWAPGQGNLFNNNCMPIGAAQDHFIETLDTNWTTGEDNTLTFTVTPNTAGTLWVRVRTSMKDDTSSASCPFLNDTSASGGTASIDQQGWSVRQYAVDVMPPNQINSVTVDPASPASALVDTFLDLDVDVGVDVSQNGAVRGSIWDGGTELDSDCNDVFGPTSTVTTLDLDITESDAGGKDYTIQIGLHPGDPCPIATSPIDLQNVPYHVDWSASEGDLEVAVEDQNGDARPNATVKLYDESYNYLGVSFDRTTDGFGITSPPWIDLPAGVYNLEAYYAGPSPFPGEEFWVTKAVTVVADQLNQDILQRNRPYATAVVMHLDEDNGPGPVLSDGSMVSTAGSV